MQHLSRKQLRACLSADWASPISHIEVIMHIIVLVNLKESMYHSPWNIASKRKELICVLLWIDLQQPGLHLPDFLSRAESRGRIPEYCDDCSIWDKTLECRADPSSQAHTSTCFNSEMHDQTLGIFHQGLREITTIHPYEKTNLWRWQDSEISNF